MRDLRSPPLNRDSDQAEEICYLHRSVLRILVTTSTFPVHTSDGTPRFVYDLADALTTHAEITVLAPGAPGASNDERLGALNIHRFRYFPARRLQVLALGQGMRDNLRRSWLARLQVLPFLVCQALATRSLARSLRVDVVNAHWLVPQGLTAAWARGRGRRFALVLHVHAGDVYLLRTLPFGSAIARYVYRRADAIFADGTHVRDTLDELLGFPSGAVVQPMGVHQATFSRHTSPTLTGEQTGHIETPFPNGFILFVGRLSEKKGAIYLIRAMQIVLKREPTIGLVIIGEGPEEMRLRAEVEHLDLGQTVRLLGKKSHKEIAGYLQACRVSVVPSIIDSRGETEGMPTVVLEALASGVRVVGSAVDGIPDVLRHWENGWLCPEKDPDALAKQILAALDDPTPSTIVEAALETAGRHTWEQVALNYMQCIQRLSTAQSDGDSGQNE